MFGSNNQSSNPVLNSAVFREHGMDNNDVMTVNGTMNKLMILMAVLVVTAAIAWNKAADWGQSLNGILIGCSIGGLVIAFVTYMKPSIAQFTAPTYCVVKGILLGVVSRMFEAAFDGIVFNAIVLTFGIMFFMLFSYRNGWIKVTPKFQKMIYAGISAYFFLIVVQLVLSLFGSGIPGLFGAGPIGIGFSLLIVGLASFTLVLDFDNIYQSAQSGAPKQAEWLGAFGLVITLVWLYLEILKLLAKLQSDD